MKIKPEALNALGTAITGAVGVVVAYNPAFAGIATGFLAVAGFLFGWATPQAGQGKPNGQ